MFKFILLLNIILAPKDHMDFEELYLDDNVYLIEQISDETISNYYDNIDSKFFGWESYVINDGVLIDYTSPSVFSYSNDGNSEYKYSYESSTTKTMKESVSVDGDIKIKGDKTIKKLATKIGVNIDASVSGDYSQTESVKEKYSLNIEVPPHTKVTLKRKGSARLTNGVSNMYVAFIKVHSGSWEVVEPITETSWYLEEYI